jgi:uncharacterized protein YggE
MGQVSVTPDIARIILGVEVQGSNLDALREDADTRMNDVIDALEESGIPSEDIRTIAYDIWVREEPIQPFDPGREPVPELEEELEEEHDVVTDDDVTTDEDDDAVTTDDDDDTATTDDDDAVTTDDDDDAVTDDDDEAVTTDEAEREEFDPEPGVQSYTLVQLVEVRITDIEMVGDVIDTALDAGANRVGSISFEVEDRQGAIEQAREQAVDEARNKAEHLAELTGVSLGPPLKIDESSPSGIPVEYEDAAMDMEVAEEAGSARIAPGQQVITVSVYITYNIE